MFLGLRSIIYPAPDLDAAKAWFSEATGVQPYFDEPFYVGFELGGYELGLNPGADAADGPVTYWGVEDADAAYASLVEHGAAEHHPVTDVGEGIRLGSVRNPAGFLVGVIENPNFSPGTPQ